MKITKNLMYRLLCLMNLAFATQATLITVNNLPNWPSNNYGAFSISIGRLPFLRFEGKNSLYLGGEPTLVKISGVSDSPNTILKASCLPSHLTSNHNLCQPTLHHEELYIPCKYNTLQSGKIGRYGIGYNNRNIFGTGDIITSYGDNELSDSAISDIQDFIDAEKDLAQEYNPALPRERDSSEPNDAIVETTTVNHLLTGDASGKRLIEIEKDLADRLPADSQKESVLSQVDYPYTSTDARGQKSDDLDEYTIIGTEKDLIHSLDLNLPEKMNEPEVPYDLPELSGYTKNSIQFGRGYDKMTLEDGVETETKNERNLMGENGYIQGSNIIQGTQNSQTVYNNVDYLQRSQTALFDENASNDQENLALQETSTSNVDKQLDKRTLVKVYHFKGNDLTGGRVFTIIGGLKSGTINKTNGENSNDEDEVSDDDENSLLEGTLFGDKELIFDGIHLNKNTLLEEPQSSEEYGVDSGGLKRKVDITTIRGNKQFGPLVFTTIRGVDRSSTMGKGTSTFEGKSHNGKINPGKASVIENSHSIYSSQKINVGRGINGGASISGPDINGRAGIDGVVEQGILGGAIINSNDQKSDINNSSLEVISKKEGASISGHASLNGGAGFNGGGGIYGGESTNDASGIHNDAGIVAGGTINGIANFNGGAGFNGGGGIKGDASINERADIHGDASISGGPGVFGGVSINGAVEQAPFSGVIHNDKTKNSGVLSNYRNVDFVDRESIPENSSINGTSSISGGPGFNGAVEQSAFSGVIINDKTRNAAGVRKNGKVDIVDRGSIPDDSNMKGTSSISGGPGFNGAVAQGTFSGVIIGDKTRIPGGVNNDGKVDIVDGESIPGDTRTADESFLSSGTILNRQGGVVSRDNLLGGSAESGISKLESSGVNPNLYRAFIKNLRKRQNEMNGDDQLQQKLLALRYIR